MIQVNQENCEKYASEIVNHLSGKIFNILTVSDEKQLRFCNRKLTGRIFSKDGQISLFLNPGGSITWDLNSETVEMEVMPNGDIKLLRIFWKTGRMKSMIMTQNPI